MRVGWASFLFLSLSACGGRQVDSSAAGPEGSGSGGAQVGAGGSGLVGSSGGALFGAGGSVESPPEPADCAGMVTGPDSTPLAVLVLLDRSAQAPWEAIQAGVLRFIERPYVQDVHLALGYFGAQGEAQVACGPGFLVAKEFERVDGSAQSVRVALDRPGPFSSRPLGPALQGALEYVGAAAPEGHRVYVVVVTASEPLACEPRSAEGLAALTASYAPFARAALVGLDPALAGSRVLTEPFSPALFLDTADASVDLADRLLEIIGRTSPCTVALPALPESREIDYDLLNVALRPLGALEEQKLLFVGDAAGCAGVAGEGWYYDTSTEPWSVRLCDATCEQSQGGEIHVRLGCSPPPVPW